MLRLVGKELADRRHNRILVQGKKKEESGKSGGQAVMWRTRQETGLGPGVRNQSWRSCWRLRKEGQSGEGTGDPSLRVEVRHWQHGGNGVARESCGKQPHTGQSRGLCGWKGAQRALLAGTSWLAELEVEQSFPEAGLHVGSASKEFASCAVCPSSSTETTGAECPWPRQQQLPAWGRRAGFRVVGWQKFYSWEEVVKRPHDWERKGQFISLAATKLRKGKWDYVSEVSEFGQRWFWSC